MNNTDLKAIKDYMDSIDEPWKRMSYVDRLESVRVAINSEGYPEGIADTISIFSEMAAADQSKVIELLRIRNQVLEWARASGDSAEIMALAEDLENEASAFDPNDPNTPEE